MSDIDSDGLRLALRHVYYELWMFFSIGLRIMEEIQPEEPNDSDDKNDDDAVIYHAFTHTSPPAQISTLEISRPVDVVSQNAQVESFAIHTRALLEFFFSEEFRTHDTDILAEDFFDKQESWMKIRVRVWDSELDNIRNRVGQEIAHITSFRKAYQVEDKVWPVKTILTEIGLLAQRFLADVPSQLKPSNWSLENEIDEAIGSS